MATDLADRSYSRPAKTKTFFLNDPTIRGIIIQTVLLALVAAFFIWIAVNTAANLQRAHIASGFGFLDQRAGFDISESLIQYTPDRSYGYALLAGLLNTLLVAVLGIVIATVIGLIVGIARLSRNWLVRQLATIYVETFRNIPPLLVIFFWYFGVLSVLPNPRDAIHLGLGFSLSNRGMYAPRPLFETGAGWVGIAFLIGLALAFGLSRWATNRQKRTGEQFPRFWAGLTVIVVLTTAAYFAFGEPVHFEVPQQTRFNLTGGVQVRPEFVSLLLALAIYTASFIAEIVRGGIQAVSHGQTEAAHALGLRPGPTLRLVTIPQAMRIIIPPITSEYLNLTKNTTLAVAIGFPDLVAIGGSVLNQTGQAVEIVMLWMAVYLGLSLITSLFMNWFNRRVALVER